MDFAFLLTKEMNWTLKSKPRKIKFEPDFPEKRKKNNHDLYKSLNYIHRLLKTKNIQFILPCLALRCFTLPCPLLPLHYSDLPCLTIPSLALRCPALKRHAIKYRISRNVYLHDVLIRKIRFCVRYPYVLNETKAFLLLLERTNYHLKS